MYDVIGDIHGYADELAALLRRLGYEDRGGSFTHPERQAVFVGDFIDRGPKIRDVLRIVRSMVKNGAAWAVMGNHEFNAIAFHTERTDQPGYYFREHSAKNRNQHAETLKQVPAGELAEYIQWFRTLPVALELDGIRVVHACWDPRAIQTIADALDQWGHFSSDFLQQATKPSTSTVYDAIETVLKGPEISLPPGTTFRDKDGNERREMRLRWYESPENRTYRDFVLPPGTDAPNVPIPSDSIAVTPYGDQEPPVFFGHYWLRSTRPRALASNVACVDFSVAKGGFLCAYRWNGERHLDEARFVTLRPIVSGDNPIANQC